MKPGEITDISKLKLMAKRIMSTARKRPILEMSHTTTNPMLNFKKSSPASPSKIYMA
jgi:hypothetical protein